MNLLRPHHRYQDVFLKQQSSVDNKMIHKVLFATVTTVQDLQDLSILWSLFCQQVCPSFLLMLQTLGPLPLSQKWKQFQRAAVP